MGILQKLFGRDEKSGPDLPITIDVDRRRAQLGELAQALDALVAGMKEDPKRLANPGWSSRVAEYGRLAGEAMTLRQSVPTREALLDLSFQVRPVFNAGAVPAGQEHLVPLQDRVVALAHQLSEVLPGERT
ncbi:MAG: hypothetical protein ACTH2Q_08725 [Propionibacteriaceae bacterium]